MKIAAKSFSLVVLYIILFYYGFLMPDENSVAQGGARGFAVLVPVFLGLFALGTVFYTRKSGGSWKKVKANLRHNILGFLTSGESNKKSHK